MLRAAVPGSTSRSARTRLDSSAVFRRILHGWLATFIQRFRERDAWFCVPRYRRRLIHGPRFPMSAKVVRLDYSPSSARQFLWKYSRFLPSKRRTTCRTCRKTTNAGDCTGIPSESRSTWPDRCRRSPAGSWTLPSCLAPSSQSMNSSTIII